MKITMNVKIVILTTIFATLCETNQFSNNNSYNIRIFEEKCLEKCGPKMVYVNFERVNDYLLLNYRNNGFRLPRNCYTIPLQYYRCHANLSPCYSKRKIYCGPDIEHVVYQKFPIICNPGKINKYLIVHFMEAYNCKCMNRNEYEKKVNHDLDQPPYIINITTLTS